MANNFINYTYCFIVFTCFVDQGDGRWKNKDRDNLQRDIELYRKLSEKIEDDIEALYDDYSEDIEENTSRQNSFYKSSTKSYTEPNKILKSHNELEFPSSTLAENLNKNDYLTSKSLTDKNRSVNVTFRFYNVNSSNEFKSPITSWPKFEDILSAMGKKYDWKNDRWIKVKEKIKGAPKKKVEDIDNHIDFYEKHNFRYRTVKLNRSKSKRNIVIAVSAVR